MSRVGIPRISYKNKTANTISTIGTVLAVIGVVLFALGQSINSESAVGIGSVFLIAGLAIIGIVWLVMKNKSYDALIQTIKEKNLEPVIASSTEEAIAVYRLAPGSKLEKYIAGLNPEAGEYISKHRNELKK